MVLAWLAWDGYIELDGAVRGSSAACASDTLLKLARDVASRVVVGHDVAPGWRMHEMEHSCKRIVPHTCLPRDDSDANWDDGDRRCSYPSSDTATPTCRVLVHTTCDTS